MAAGIDESTMTLASDEANGVAAPGKFGCPAKVVLWAAVAVGPPLDANVSSGTADRKSFCAAAEPLKVLVGGANP